jgi:antitoxin PrlF
LETRGGNLWPSGSRRRFWFGGELPETVDKKPPITYNELKIYGSMTSGDYHMAALKLSVVQEKGQVTIPSEIRKKLGLKKGDLVAFVETEQGVLISPREVIAAEALDQIGQILREKGLTLEELIESGREIRGKLVEEEYGLKTEE